MTQLAFRHHVIFPTPQTQLALRAQTELALRLKENYGMDKIHYITCVFTMSCDEEFCKMLRNDPKSGT